MASIGHEVLGTDIDEDKVSLLNSGKAWFHEPGLDELLAENIQAGRLRFTTSFAQTAEFGGVHFIGVATPGRPDGSYDLSQLHAAVSSLVPYLDEGSLLIGKSTVPPGTAAALQAMVNGTVRGGAQGSVEVAWNPEFLQEGCAVENTLRPDRIVAGTASAHAAEIIREIYRPLTDAGIPLVVTDLTTSELVKGAANAFLAAKISFVNAMADICAVSGGDISALARALGMDPRIGPAFLKAGIGYGGACLPKDVRGLGMFARGIGVRSAATLLDAIDQVNAARTGQAVTLVCSALGGRGLAGRRVAVWGAAYKPGTDDIRDSPALNLVSQLRELGADVTLYDPMASGNALVAFPELTHADSARGAVTGADVVVVVTAWPEFAQVAPAEIASAVARKTIVDACQGIDLAAWRAAGWEAWSLTGWQRVPGRAATEAPMTGDHVR